MSVTDRRHRRGGRRRRPDRPAAGRRPRRQRHHRAGPDALGPRGRRRGVEAPRLDRGGRDLASRSSTRSSRSASSSHAAGRHPHRARRHGRLVARARGHHAHLRRRRSPCSTRPTPVRCAPRCTTGSPTTAVVISSKSGSTVETDSQRRVYEQAFRDAGIDPHERIIIVTDPGSPLDVSARAAGYRVFNADPNVGGRYSALTAFGLVPVRPRRRRHPASSSTRPRRSSSSSPSTRAENPGLDPRCRDRRRPRRCKDKLGIVADGTHIVGFADWVEQLIAESTGKQGTGLLPVVLDVDAPELDARPARPAGRAARRRRRDEIREVARRARSRSPASLGAQLLVWEYATVVAGRLLGINPFDQPDVESAKIAARGLLDARPEPVEPPRSSTDGIEVRGTPAASALQRPRSRGDRRLLLETLARRRLPRRAGLRRPRRPPRSSPSCATCSRRARGARSPSAGVRASCTRPASSTRAVRRSACSCRSWRPPTRRTSRSPTGRSPSASSSRRRPPATRACSPTTVDRCSPSP